MKLSSWRHRLRVKTSRRHRILTNVRKILDPPLWTWWSDVHMTLFFITIQPIHIIQYQSWPIALYALSVYIIYSTLLYCILTIFTDKLFGEILVVGSRYIDCVWFEVWYQNLRKVRTTEGTFLFGIFFLSFCCNLFIYTFWNITEPVRVFRNSCSFLPVIIFACPSW